MPVLVLGSRASAPASSTKVLSFSPSCGPPAHGGEESRVCYRPSLSYSEPDDDTSFRRMQGRRTPAILRDRQAGEELAQDVFVKAYQRLDTFAVRRRPARRNAGRSAMIHGLDTGFLVAAEVREHAEHGGASGNPVSVHRKSGNPVSVHHYCPKRGTDIAPRSSGKEDSRKLETFQMESCG